MAASNAVLGLRVPTSGREERGSFVGLRLSIESPRLQQVGRNKLVIFVSPHPFLEGLGIDIFVGAQRQLPGLELELARGCCISARRLWLAPVGIAARLRHYRVVPPKALCYQSQRGNHTGDCRMKCANSVRKVQKPPRKTRILQTSRTFPPHLQL